MSTFVCFNGLVSSLLEKQQVIYKEEEDFNI